MSDILPDSPTPETTGRFIVTFREGGQSDALAALKKGAGVTKSRLMSSAEFSEAGLNLEQLPDEGGVILEHLGIAVLRMDDAAAGMMAQDAGDDAAILAIELLAAAQGVDLRAPHITSPKLQAVMQRIRGAVPHYDIDRLFAPDIEAIKTAVQNAEIAAHSPLRFASQEA